MLCSENVTCTQVKVATEIRSFHVTTSSSLFVYKNKPEIILTSLAISAVL